MPVTLRTVERIAMIGDSITADPRWWSRAREVLACARPGLALDLRNLAVPGDTVHAACERYDADIAPTRPTLAAIMLGMNDVHRERYGDDQPSDAAARRAEALVRYEKGYDLLIGRLRRDGARVVLCTPSPYDQKARLPAPALRGVDDALAGCGEVVRGLARRHGCEVVDLHGPMRAIGARLRRDDPSATLIGEDRVHPGDLGHAVMARLFLAEAGVGATTLAAEGPGAWEHLGAIPAPPDVPGAVALAGVGGGEVALRAALPAGRWRLVVDGVPIHEAEARAWELGVALDGLAGPLARRALEIRSASAAVAAEERRWRLALMLRSWSRRAGSGEEGPCFERYLDERRRERHPGGWLRIAVDDCRALLADRPAYERGVERLRARLAEASRPRAHRFELLRA